MSDGLRDRITHDLKAWDSITDHRTGTKGDTATAKWLADEIQAVGQRPATDQFAFKRRVLTECSLTIGTTRILGVPLFDGGATGSEPIRGGHDRIDPFRADRDWREHSSHDGC
jgi:hypothetical protein